MTATRCPTSTSWPLERVLFALAGTVTLLSALLSTLVSTWFLLLTAFVGINQWVYVSRRACPASVVLRRAFGLTSALYPNPSRPRPLRRPEPESTESQADDPLPPTSSFHTNDVPSPRLDLETSHEHH